MKGMISTKGGARMFAWGGGGGGAKCLATAAQAQKFCASPEGRGGGGIIRHIFFPPTHIFSPRLQKISPKNFIMG